MCIAQDNNTRSMPTEQSMCGIASCESWQDFDGIMYHVYRGGGRDTIPERALGLVGVVCVSGGRGWTMSNKHTHTKASIWREKTPSFGEHVIIMISYLIWFFRILNKPLKSSYTTR